MVSDAAREEIRKIALKNAMDYGKARESTVINGTLSKFPELKSEMKDLASCVREEVARINSLDKKALDAEAAPFIGEYAAKERERAEKTAKPKMVLEGAEKGKFTTRFPPEPNGYMQIGHAKVVFMEREFTDIYEGRMGLYFDDTNPEAERQEFVDAFEKDLGWLGIKFDTEYYASDNIEVLYGYAETLIGQGDAYVCGCSPDAVKEGRKNRSECEHRSNSPEENAKAWAGMLAGREKKAILRLKGDMKSENTAMMDPTLFRIKEAPHYRQGSKYSVWPTYDFNTPIVDSMKGVTAAIRSKEYELRDEVYYRVLDLLRLRKPRIYSVARLEIKNNVTSKRKINELIKNGLISGYDDPRLVTITALRRRGIMPAAIKSFVLRFGMSKTDSKVGIDMLLAENRKLIDHESKRMFFIKDPRRLEVKGIPENLSVLRMKAHPSEDLGFREYRQNGVFFINSYDAINLNIGDVARLKDAFDIRIDGIEGDSIAASYTEAGSRDFPKLQWVSEGSYVKAKAVAVGDLLKEDGAFNEQSLSVTEGLVEGHASSLSEGDTVQLERMGYFKLDDKNEMSFISI